MGETTPGAERAEKGHDENGLIQQICRTQLKLLDQGEGGTCVIYALALALCRHLLLSSGVHIIVTECLGAIKQLDKARDAAREGNFVEDFQGEVLRNMTDKKTGAYGTIQIQIQATRNLRRGAEHVLVYDQTEGDPGTKHCVYMERVTEKGFMCLNSHGSKDPFPLVEMERKGNRLYSVEANWTPVDMKTNKPIENISQVLRPIEPSEPIENISQGPESPKWSTQHVVRVVLVTNVITVSVTFLER